MGTIFKIIITIVITVAILALIGGILTMTGGVAGLFALILGWMFVFGIAFKVYDTLFGLDEENKNNSKKVSSSSDITQNLEEPQQSSVEFNFELREKIFAELNKNTRMIKNSTPAITKTLCFNLEISDKETKNAISRQIEIIKNVYELHQTGYDVKQIILRIKVYQNEKILESEVENILKIFQNI